MRSKFTGISTGKIIPFSPPRREDFIAIRFSLKIGIQGASSIARINTDFQSSIRLAACAGSTIESALIASASNSLLQYFDQFQPPGPVPTQPRIGP